MRYKNRSVNFNDFRWNLTEILVNFNERVSLFNGN